MVLGVEVRAKVGVPPAPVQLIVPVLGISRVTVCPPEKEALISAVSWGKGT